MAFAVWNSYSVPMSLAFNPPSFNSTVFKILELIVDLSFGLDIAVSFRTIIIDDFGEEEHRQSEIAKHYLQQGFIIDILSAFPFDLVTMFTKSDNQQDPTQDKWTQIFSILKLGRLLRFNKIIAYMKTNEDVKATFRICKMVLFLFVYIHLFTCLWWICVREKE